MKSQRLPCYGKLLFMVCMFHFMLSLRYYRVFSVGSKFANVMVVCTRQYHTILDGGKYHNGQILYYCIPPTLLVCWVLFLSQFLSLYNGCIITLIREEGVIIWQGRTLQSFEELVCILSSLLMFCNDNCIFYPASYCSLLVALGGTPQSSVSHFIYLPVAGSSSPMKYYVIVLLLENDTEMIDIYCSSIIFHFVSHFWMCDKTRVQMTGEEIAHRHELTWVNRIRLLILPMLLLMVD